MAIQEAGAGDLFEFAYFDFPEIGSAVEVLFLDIAQMPPAEAVIHPKGEPTLVQRAWRRLVRNRRAAWRATRPPWTEVEPTARPGPLVPLGSTSERP